jgi:hypothetical protein
VFGRIAASNEDRQVTRFKPLVNGPFVTYTHVGWDGSYAWGLKKSTSASLADSHKYRATLDWVRANP